MSSGESDASEPSGHRPPGQGEQGRPPEASPPQSWPAPGQQPEPGQAPPQPQYQAPQYPPPGQPYGVGQGHGGGQAYGGWPVPGGAVPPPGTGQGPLSPQDERTWAMAAHLSSILGVWAFFLGAIGPLVVLLVQGPRSAYVRAQAIEALNFNISILVYSIVAWILAFILVGFVILAALFVIQVVFTIIATVKTSNGESYRYPLTFRLVS